MSEMSRYAAAVAMAEHRQAEENWEAIERVREVAENEDYGRIFAEYGPDAELIRVVPLDALLAALDGPDE